MEKPPEFLYQYCPPEKRARCNLMRRVVYFNSPANFKDQLDCPESPGFGNMPEAIRVMHRNNCLKPAWVSSDITAHNAVKRQWRAMRESIGIACLSESPYNRLMWSHYSGGDKGFCLEFDTRDAALFGGDMLHPVKYEPYPSYLDAAVVLGGDIDKARRLFLTKGEKWQYEREWRIIRETQGRVRYDAKTLTTIYVGIAATEETKEFVRRVGQKLYPHARLQKVFSFGHEIGGSEPLDICSTEKPWTAE